MRLGLMTGYSGARIDLPFDLIHEADRLGYHAVWTAEAYGSDAITPLAWIGAMTKQIGLGTAIMQMPARTPAMTAMTAATLDQLSGGRFLLGLGLSGPQVVEGWHGVSYARPLQQTREYVSIVRTILQRQSPLEHHGTIFDIPYTGNDASGLGKPLKLILHPRADIPIYLAAIGPNNVALAAEIADGWLPIFFSPERFSQTYANSIQLGLARRPGKTMADLDIAPSVSVVVGDDLEACYNQVRPLIALYVGGMGAKGRNFYHDLACRYGFEAAADAIQTAYLAGQIGEAWMAVPDDLVDAVALVGPPDRIRDRVQLWQDGPATTLNLMTADIETVRLMAELLL
jgi:F420-dependent oxidoreductase-like protein